MGDAFVPINVKSRDAGTLLLPSSDIHNLVSLRSVSTHSLQDPVTHVCFSPRAPYELAAASGFSISIIDAHTDQIRRTLSRFKDLAYSPHFKHDGRLLVAGCANGSARVFDMASRAVLRDFKGHKGPVRSTRFSSDGLRVMTGSDDSVVKVWDLPTSKSLFALDDATDYIRAQAASPASRHVWMVGSADRYARLYDLRSQDCLFTLDHKHQVDDVIILPGGARAVTIGGSEAKVWDFFAGGKHVHTIAPHAKAVTCGAVHAESGTLATAGLDGSLKLHDISSFETKGVMSFSSQILSINISADGKRYGVGMADGTVDIRASPKFKKGLGTTGPAGGLQEREFEGWGRGFERLDKDTEKPRPGTLRYFNRGGNAPVGDLDVVVRRASQYVLKDYDRCLRKFEYSKALDLAVESGKTPVLVGVVEELIMRGGLKGALIGRTLNDLCPLLKIIRKHVRDPYYSLRLCHLLNVVLDMYGNEFGKSEEADKHLSVILQNVKSEIAVGRDMTVMQGAAEAVMYASKIAS